MRYLIAGLLALTPSLALADTLDKSDSAWILTATALVSYSKARAELYVPSFEVGLLERGERVGLLAAGAILDLLIPALWIIAIGSTITVAQRFALAKRELDRLDADEKSAGTRPAPGTGELQEPTT